MRLRYACPRCEKQLETELVVPGAVECECTWTREVTAAGFDGDTPTQCAVCGCTDLWRQKDFPQSLGLFMVGLGIIGSTIAWSQHMPVVAIGILMFFAIVDLVLYACMSDMLVCYRCRARHRKTSIHDDHPNFDLEVAERYRQQQIRMKREGQQRPRDGSDPTPDH